MAIARRRIRRRRPMAPPPSPWGAAGGGFGGENMYAPAVMPGGWDTPKQAVMPGYGAGGGGPAFEGMATGGGYGGPGAAPWKEMGGPGKGFGAPPPGVMMQPGGPMNQFGGFQGGAQQQGPNAGLLGNIMGGGMRPMGPPGMGQPAVMPDMGQPGMGGGMAEPQPGMGGGMGQPGGGMTHEYNPGGGMVQAEPTPYDPGVSAGRLAEAQRLAGLGKMGRAKQQWELGGGDWGGQAHRFLRG